MVHAFNSASLDTILYTNTNDHALLAACISNHQFPSDSLRVRRLPSTRGVIVTHSPLSVSRGVIVPIILLAPTLPPTPDSTITRRLSDLPAKSKLSKAYLAFIKNNAQLSSTKVIPFQANANYSNKLILFQAKAYGL